MRDGKWKLVRPLIPETKVVPREFIEADRAYTYHPEQFSDILHADFPAFRFGENPPQLFNLEDDPLEKNDISSKHPDIVEKMDRETDKWFEEVEKERKSRQLQKN